VVKHLLRFTLRMGRGGLIIGQLDRLKDGEVVNAYQATSSVAGKQASGSWNNRGGLIPPDEKFLNGELYEVSTTPLWMPQVRGVEGSFYQIHPFEIQTDGATRGDFGIHFDANVPGSMGCIVLPTQRGWDAFRNDMKWIADSGAKRVDLDICYL
jgi:hypothetical protein